MKKHTSRTKSLRATKLELKTETVVVLTEARLADVAGASGASACAGCSTTQAPWG